MSEHDEYGGIEPIAIIGMSCRFPDAKNIDEFWHNLKTGKESVKLFTNEELLAAGLDKELIADPAYVKAFCVIDDIELFDYSFFDYSADEAELIDPQQRIFLECAYEAFEDAGYLPHTYNGDIGVFGGVKASGYKKILDPLFKRPGTLRSFQAVLGTTVDQTCLRISHALNLRGPSIGVQTACSTSIVAAHMASESLRNGECDMALAGASGITIPQNQGYLYDEDVITSPDGHCRAFDAKAQGTIPGNGVGIILLKRLTDAIKDNDHIYAVIRGSAVNNDGSAKMGYQSPSIEGQKRVIEEALLMAEINAESISYVEGNGTGTFLGDSMEIEALTRAFRVQTDKEQFCGIGSVKTNIGHLTQASGVASLIKTVLSLKNKQLVPSLNCRSPNPQLQGSPFYVIKKILDWKTSKSPRRAGINSFAIGGTNAHMILEEAPSAIPVGKKDKDSFHILTLSAKSEKALRKIVTKYGDFLKHDDDNHIEDICFTSNVGRFHYPFRISLIANSKIKLSEQINALKLGKKMIPGLAKYTKVQANPIIALYFSDIHSGYISISRFFYKKFQLFRETINYCADILKNDHRKNLLFDIFMNSQNNIEDCKPTTLFVIEYAFFNILSSWKILPSIVLGHGIGEYVAACAAGVFSLKEGLKLVSLIEDNKYDIITKNNSQPSSEDKLFDMPLFSPPKSKIVSGVTGLLLDKTQIYGKNYWLHEVIKRPEHNMGWSCFQEQNVNVLIAIGPGEEKIDTFVENNLPKDGISLHLSKGDQEEWLGLLKFLGGLYVRGKEIDWDQYARNGSCQRISLPTYPFEKKRCWFTG